MASREDIRWFKENFTSDMEKRLQETVFDADMLTALACQETGSLWSVMRRKALGRDEIVARCCGDTLDADRGRRAFPRTRAELLAAPNGRKMFDIARAALLEIARYVPGYGFAHTNGNKFCHGFGVFQYDLQFFKVDPAYFLERKYEKFDNTLAKAIHELNACLGKAGLQGRTSITDREFASVAIAYNTGRYDPARGLKQGYRSNGKYYGEMIADYLKTSRSVVVEPILRDEPNGLAPASGPKAGLLRRLLSFLLSGAGGSRSATAP